MLDIKLKVTRMFGVANFVAIEWYLHMEFANSIACFFFRCLFNRGLSLYVQEIFFVNFLRIFIHSVMDHLTTGMKTIWIYCCYFMCNTKFLLLIVFTKFKLNLYLVCFLQFWFFLSFQEIQFFSYKKASIALCNRELITNIHFIFIYILIISYQYCYCRISPDVTLLAFFGNLTQSLSDSELLHSLLLAELFCNF